MNTNAMNKVAQMIARLNKGINAMDAGEFIAVKREMEALLNDLTVNGADDAESAKPVRMSAAKAAANVLKAATRDDLRYAWTNEKNQQIFTDGFRAFRLNESAALPLPPRPADMPKAPNIEGVMASYTRGEALPLPTIASVKHVIATQKARHIAAGKKPKDFHAVWDFGPGLMAVDANYLADSLAIMGEDAQGYVGWTDKTSTKVFSPVLFVSERGDAMLLPIRTEAKVAEQKAAQAEAARLKTDDALRISERLQRAERRLKEYREELRKGIDALRSETVTDANGEMVYSVEATDYENVLQLQKMVEESEQRVAELKAELDKVPMSA